MKSLAVSAPHWSKIECEWNNLQCPEAPLCKTCAEAELLRRAVKQGLKFSYWQPVLVAEMP